MEDGDEKYGHKIEAGLGEIGCENGRWMGQNCVQWQILILTMLNLWDLQK
jgi:hypothetical protein